MSLYNSKPISQWPPGSAVLGTDAYVATDTTDLTSSPSGTTKKYTIDQLQAYLVTTFGNSNILSARVGTTGNLAATYLNGAAGVGATLTSVANEALIIDDITMIVGDRVLVSSQTSSFQNGVYIVTNIGSGSTQWVMTRSSEFDGSPMGEITQGDFIAVIFGTLNALTWWFLTSGSNPVVGTDPIIFTEQIGSALPYNGFQIYVSQQIGSDITGTGSLSHPLATINAAITLAGSPPDGMPITIIVMDGASYDEAVVVNSENVYISMPFAQINYSGTGDALTIGASAKLLINAASIQNSGTGNAITNNGGSLFAEIQIIQSGTVALEQAGSGGISLLTAGQAIQGSITNPASGNIFYTTNLRIGSDDVTVLGFTPQGCSQIWTVGATLSFADTVNGIVGTVSGDNVNGGIVGEVITTNIPFGSAVTMTTATPIDISTITLTPGDWDVHGNIYINSSISMTQAFGWLSLTSASAPDQSQRTASINVGMTTFGSPAPIMRVNVTSNTTVYISATATFASGATTACGNIYARRIR